MCTLVTEVQTCALPISPWRWRISAPAWWARYLTAMLKSVCGSKICYRAKRADRARSDGRRSGAGCIAHRGVTAPGARSILEAARAHRLGVPARRRILGRGDHCGDRGDFAEIGRESCRERVCPYV